MNNAEVLIKFKGDTSDATSKTNNLANSIKGLTSKITLANVVASGITKTINTINASLSSAINRVDVLNNFPKVMSNLGISAKESEEVITDLSEKLKGIPTTLDKAAMSVQRFTSKNGNVKKSEEIFLAVNNAILAGGASTDIQANALEQLSQAYAKGKPDMMEWRSLMTAMPAQLKQVAVAMGYTDAAMLGEEVRSKEGAEEFSRMIETMVNMNKEGVKGFKSFEEQARNATGGIGTNLTNMKTAIARGVASMLSSIDKSLESMGGIKGVLSSIGQIAEKVLTKIGNGIAKIIPKIIDIANWINKNKEWLLFLTMVVATFIATFKTITTVISIINMVKTAFLALNAVILANPIAILISAIMALVAIFIYLWNNCEAFKNFFVGLWEIIKLTVVGAIDFIIGIFTGIINFVANNWQALLLMLVNPFVGAFKLLYDNCEGFRNFIDNFVKTIINFFKKLPGELKKIGKNMIQGLIDGVKSIKDKAVNAVKNVGKGLLDGIKGVLGIHSPSKEFALIGKFSVLGYTEALDDMQDTVDKQIAETFGISPQLQNSSALHYSPNVVVNNEVNVSQDPLGQMVSNIKSYSGGAKNDYNFGMGV